MTHFADWLGKRFLPKGGQDTGVICIAPSSQNIEYVVNAAFLFFETSKLWALIMYIS